MKKVVRCALTGFLLSTSAYASDFEYSGYMRSGFGFSERGTDQVCFNLDKSTGKDRLGNECETYIESAFIKHHRLGEGDGPSFSTNLRLAFVSNGDRDWEATADNNLNVSLREAFVKSKDLFSKDGADVWVGKRFYRRHDINMFDFYYLANTGQGAGVENIDLGIGKAHVAVIRNVPSLQDPVKVKEGEETDGTIQTNLDFRLTDIKAGPGSLGLVYIHSNSGNRGHKSGEEKWEAMTGGNFTTMYQMNVMGGFNKTVVQYGYGLLGAAGHSSQIDGGASEIAKGSDTDAREKSSTLRVHNQLVAEFGKKASVGFVTLYKSVDSGGVEDKKGDELPKMSEILVGVRPSYYLSDNMALTMSYSFNTIDNYAVDAEGDWVGASMHKLTIAPEFTMSTGYWSRPKLRLFATYASWNDEARDAVLDSTKGTTYANDTSGFSAGAQLEVWW